MALRFAPPVLEDLGAVQHGLTGALTRRENLHMTLCFLGEVPADRIPVLRQQLGPLAKRTPAFSMTLDRMETFGTGKNRLACLTGTAPEPLSRLVRDMEAALRTHGFPLENREFRPHVTLARRFSGPNVDFTPIRFTARELHLMCSERIEGVLTYTPLFTAPFGR